jgi:hypothetical protein
MPSHLLLPLLQWTEAPFEACCLVLHLLLPAWPLTEGCQKSHHHPLQQQQHQYHPHQQRPQE